MECVLVGHCTTFPTLGSDLDTITLIPHSFFSCVKKTKFRDTGMAWSVEHVILDLGL